MATSISWTDGTGAASITNGKPVPGDRFSSWAPRNTPVGDAQDALGTGARYMFSFRTDYTASFELRGIPNTSQSLALRLIAHLEGGGSCSVATGDGAARTYGTCTLAPGSRPEFTLSDPNFIEYTLAFELLNASAAAMLCIYS